MPNRIIKESINESMGLGDCSIFTQDLYKRLITYADDYGRFNGDPEIMRARLYPRALDDVSEGDLVDSLTELVGVGKIAFYIPKIDSREYNKKLFGCFPKWEEHQRVRNTRAKYPDPEKEINDWYLRRFIPIKLKIKIFERDGFICQECGKDYSLKDVPTRRAMRLIGGALHIDHIVPVAQGGRATEENLRLLCESCNLSRQRYFTIDEIVQFSLTCRNSPRPAATRRDLRPESNPIQSNLESESNPNPTSTQSTQQNLFDTFWTNYPKKRSKGQAEKAWAKIKPNEQLTGEILSALERAKTSADWQKDGGQYIPYPATWLNAKGWEDDYTPAAQTAPKSWPVIKDWLKEDGHDQT